MAVKVERYKGSNVRRTSISDDDPYMCGEARLAAMMHGTTTAFSSHAAILAGLLVLLATGTDVPGETCPARRATETCAATQDIVLVIDNSYSVRGTLVLCPHLCTCCALPTATHGGGPVGWCHRSLAPHCVSVRRESCSCAEYAPCAG